MQSDSSIFKSLISSMPNYSPTGQKIALKTSDSQLPANERKKSLTTFNVSDILQGTAMFKPSGLVYNSFNEVLSKSLGQARNAAVNGKPIGFSKAQVGLMGYDTSSVQSFDIALGASQLASSASSAGTGGASAGGALPTQEGNPPAGIPRGPFKPSIKRYNNREWIQNTGVQEILLTGQQIIELLLAAGCDLNGAVFMWALCKRESSFHCNRAGVNDNGSTDAGLWQINNGMKKGTNGELYQEFDGWRGNSIEQMCDPWVNVSFAMRMSGNGTRFVPWQTTGNYSTPDDSHLRGVNIEEARNFFLENGYRV